MGFVPVIRTLLRIEPLSAAIAGATPDGLIFTSLNAVHVWSGMTPARDTPVLAVGDATAEAARAAGFASVRSAGCDLDALAALIRSDRALHGARLLHPAAETPAGDLQSLVGDHARIDPLPVYRAAETGAPPPDAFDAVLIHSPRAARALAAALSPDAARGRIACAISANAGAALSALPFAEIRIAAHPDEASLLACLGKPPAGV